MWLTTSWCVALFMLVGLLHPEIQRSIPEPIRSGSPASPKIALCCNVFWGEEYLPDMLNTLDANQIKATFFIGGTWAQKNQQLLLEIANRGHGLANHSYSHPHPNLLTKQKNQEQIVKTDKLIQEITGKQTTLYAPPYGEYNDTVLLAAHELGYRTILWSIDTIDWQRPSAEIIKQRVLKKLHPGAIILMHPTAPTAQALPGLIKEIQNRGYQVVPVSELLE